MTRCRVSQRRRRSSCRAFMLLTSLLALATPVTAIASLHPIRSASASSPKPTSPIYLVSPPDGSRRLFIVDQIGVIRIVDASGAMLPAPFLDVRGKLVTLRPNFDERGLLGLAFHPGYATNGRFFVYYSAPLRPSGPAGFDCTARAPSFSIGHCNVAERLPTDVAADDKPQSTTTAALSPSARLLLIRLDRRRGGAEDVGPATSRLERDNRRRSTAGRAANLLATAAHASTASSALLDPTTSFAAAPLRRCCDEISPMAPQPYP